MWKFLAIAVASLLAVPEAKMVPNATLQDEPARAVLADEAMANVFGGAGTASIGVPFPEEFAASNLGSAQLEWNQDGNRCQSTCANGPSNVGFDVSSYIFVLNNLSTPVLELYADGKGRAKSTANFIVAAGSYNAYSASLMTKCVGGTKSGQFCTSDSFCTGGRCAACDDDGTCSNRPALGPCQNVCINGPTPGKMCQLQTDCGSGGDCVEPWVGNADTCYLLARCANNSGTDCIQDCTVNGIDPNTDADDVTKPGPFHSAMVRVTSTAGSTTFEIGREENLYRMEKRNGALNNCAGPLE